jgi:hypothetical protein
MRTDSLLKKSRVIGIIALLCSLAILPALGASTHLDYPLPPPMSVDISLEQTIFQRRSVREFSEEPVTDEELSTILWAAYGYIDEEKRTVPGIGDTYAARIYVLKEDAVYTYNPVNHSLVFYKDGDYRDIVGWQYSAPIQLGLVWDKNESDNEIHAGAEIGQIGQNIQFMANALDMGTVVTGQIPSPIDRIGLPSNEEGKIVMPIGHPEFPADLRYRPFWLSLLPRIKISDMSLTTALQERNEGTSWSDEQLTRKELSHVMWASYGYSYFLDYTESEINVIKRHRTVPSAHGYYPLRMYAVTQSGIYRYYPGILNIDKWGLPIMTFLLKIRNGDKRNEVAEASESFVASAPLIIISVLDIGETIKWDDLSDEIFRWIWSYEAGASAHTVLLEATTRGLSANIVPPTDPDTIRSLLRLNESYIPFYIVPVGK